MNPQTTSRANRPASWPQPEDVNHRYRVGTSGYSFQDWVGPFYPKGTKSADMLDAYCRHFDTLELNYTFYRMPTAHSIERLALRTASRFGVWVKANQQITHEQNRTHCQPFLEAMLPLQNLSKLEGILLQFPQSFHRTVQNRRFLAAVLADWAATPLAVEFRHFSWDHPSTYAGLRDRSVALVIPDVPPIRNLHQPEAQLTSRTGYLRLHSRREDLWYAGAVERYDYNYSQKELQELIRQWQPLAEQADKVYAFFNNCHRGQAAENAEAFRKLLGQL